MARRLIQTLLTLLVVSFLVFFVARLTGNPAELLLPLEATPEQRQVLIDRLGLDDSVWVQYSIFLQNALRGDFGNSLRTGLPVTELVNARIGNSLLLAAAAMAVAVVTGIPLGIVAAVRRDTVWDRAATGVALLGQSLPTFFTGIVAARVFGVGLGWLPVSGMGSARHFVLPSLTLGLFATAGLVRFQRSSMIEVLQSEFIKNARLKGLPEYRVLFVHALRNAVLPVITFVGFMYGILIAAAITTEVVFSWPGLGRLSFEAVQWRDFPLIQYVVLVWVAIVMLINLIVDIGYGFLDPRTKARAV